MFRRKRKKIEDLEKFYANVPCMRGTRNVTYSGGKTDLLIRYVKEFLDEEEQMRQRNKKMSAEELLDAITKKFEDTQLRSCPLCDNKALLQITLRKYTQFEGFAGGYDINAKICCSKCKCGLSKELLYTNITFGNESDGLEQIDEIVSNYVKQWNVRYDDNDKSFAACRLSRSAEPYFCDQQRLDDYTEDKSDE